MKNKIHIEDLKPTDTCFYITSEGQVQTVTVRGIELGKDNYSIKFNHTSYSYMYSNFLNDKGNHMDLQYGADAANYYQEPNNAEKSKNERTVFFNLSDAIKKSNEILTERMNKLMEDTREFTAQIIRLRNG